LFWCSFTSVFGWQELGYSKFGTSDNKIQLKNEGMFYTHILAVPYFALLAGDMGDHAAAWNLSPSMVRLACS
jgi:hypothetical protein